MTQQADDSVVQRDPVAVALGWLIGEELARGGRDRSADMTAARRALQVPADDAQAFEGQLHDAALAAAEGEHALTAVERAAIQVYFDLADITHREGREPPWELVSLNARMRIGAKRQRLLQTIPELHAATPASLRENFEHPLLERLARLVRARSERRTGAGGRVGAGALPAPSRTQTRLSDRTSVNTHAAREGGALTAISARRNSDNAEWVAAIVADVERHHSDLISVDKRSAIERWLTRRTRPTRFDGDRDPDVEPSIEHGGAVWTAVVAAVLRELGREAIHVLAAAGLLGDGAGPLEWLDETELAPVERQALRSETELSLFVQRSGIVHEPFVALNHAASPATLLRPTYAVVPFDDSAGQLERLASWADAPEPLAVVAIRGPAGSGKTRLAIEFCRTMSQTGWRAAALTRAADLDGAALGALLQWHARRVVVVDYAEDRPDHVRTLLARLHGNGSDRYPIRLVLNIRRPFGSAWTSAFRGSDGDALLDTAQDLDVIDAWQHVSRQRFFMSAQSAFAPLIAEEPTRPRSRAPRWVQDEQFDRPLLLAAAALTDLTSARGEPRTTVRHRRDIIAGLLAHEANYWRGTPVDPNETTAAALTARAIVAAALGTADNDLSEAKLAARLVYAIDFRETPSATRRQWARWLKHQYPNGRLEPDLLLEHLVVEQCADTPPDDPIDWDAALHADRPTSELGATLTLIAHCAQRSGAFAENLSQTWADALPRLIERVGDDPDDELLAGLTAAAEVLAIPVHPVLSVARLPDGRQFAPLGVVIARKALNALLERNVDDDRVFDAFLALGVYHGVLEDHAAAVETAIAATTWVRQAFTGEEPRRQAELAQALSNLGANFAEIGEHEAALDATHEAVALCRGMIAADDADSTSDLAAALHNLGAACTAAGDHHAGLAATSEAIDLLRSLPQAEPQRSQLAIALRNRALGLLHLGTGPDDAATDAAEAVAILRPLAQHAPAEYNDELLKALSTFSTAATRSDAHEAALEAQREAVAIARSLYAADPDRTRASLVRHLRILATRLAQDGQEDESAAVRAEAADLNRP